MRSRLNPQTALKARAGLDLDVFVFEYIFDGVAEDGRILPFSSSAGASKMLVVKMMASNPGMVMGIEYGPEHFSNAVKEGYLYDGTEIPAWLVWTNRDIHAYGRTLEEAIAKLAIQDRAREGS